MVYFSTKQKTEFCSLVHPDVINIRKQIVVTYDPVFAAGVASSLLWRLSQSCLNILSLVHTIQLFCYMAQGIVYNWSYFASICVHRSRILNWLYVASICVHRSRILNVRSRNYEKKIPNLLMSSNF